MGDKGGQYFAADVLCGLSWAIFYFHYLQCLDSSCISGARARDEEASSCALGLALLCITFSSLQPWTSGVGCQPRLPF
ncbi:hypothetical protein BX070DRAFT_230925 [Coemansia spiralis]|nr:hypothetical protein BX070DRAFT_230925 [Coemansia spiralis]